MAGMCLPDGPKKLVLPQQMSITSSQRSNIALATK
jgi:hypothetical protein